MLEKQLVEFSLEDGSKFLVEVEEPENTAVERVDTGAMASSSLSPISKAETQVRSVLL